MALLLPTDCVSLPSGKLGTTVEPQSEGNADISVNSCTAHTGTVIIVEVTGWEEERANNQLRSSKKAKGEHKYVFVSWLQIMLAMNISV